MRDWLYALLAAVFVTAVVGCGDDEGAADGEADSESGEATSGQGSDAQGAEASGGTSSGRTDGASSGGTDGTDGTDGAGIGSMTLRDVAAEAQAFVDAGHTNCLINLIVAQGIEPDGTVATPTPKKVVGWSVNFICDGETVAYNDLTSFPKPYETVGPAALDAATFAVDAVPDSPSIMSDYADAGCTPVTGEMFESLRVSAFPGTDGTGPRMIVFVGSSAGDWSGSFDASGLVEQTIPCM